MTDAVVLAAGYTIEDMRNMAAQKRRIGVLGLFICVAAAGLLATAYVAMRPVHIDIALTLTDENLYDYRSLFEMRDRSGKVVCAAGFSRGSQTYRTLNDRQVEFYCDAGETDFIDLGRPSPATWRPALVATATGLVDLSSDMIRTGNEWSPRADAGRVENLQDVGAIIEFVAAGRDAPARVSVDGQTILTFPGETLQIGYYYGGSIYVITSGRGDAALTAYHLDTKSTERVPMPANTRGVYSIMGYEGNLVIGGTNWLLRYDGERLSTLYERPEVEFYSLLSIRGGILAGSYPEGFLYHIDPAKWTVRRLEEPPLPAGSFVNDGSVESLVTFYRMGEPYYREAQSLALYGGRLYVGMFPWGEVWEYSDHWIRHPMFGGQQSASTPWPYYDEMLSRIHTLSGDPRVQGNPKWLLDAFWARRISSLVPSAQGLAVGLGNFTGFALDPDRDTFMQPREVEQYGRVNLIRRPAVLAGLVSLKGPTVLSFIITHSGKMRILQDGDVIAEKDAHAPARWLTTVHIGEGVYGPTPALSEWHSS